jgi:uncharacterized protein
MRPDENVLKRRIGSDRALSLLMLVTRECPFSCVSCAMHRGPSAISRENLRRGVDLLLQEEGALELQFFGGEPLLEYDLVREAAAEAAQLAVERGRRLTMVVTTSLLPLTAERAHELAALGVEFLVSLDGELSVHSRQRPSRAGEYPWELIQRHLDGLILSGAAYTVNMVVRPESVESLPAGVAFLLDRGVRRFQFAYALGVEWGPERMAAFETALARADALCSEKGADVLNRRGAPEPVLIDGQLVLDVDGELSVGCWTVLETVFPDLRRAFARGPVSAARRLPVDARSPREQLERLLSAARTPGERRIMLDNVDLGRRMARFWAREEASRAR